MKLIIKEFNELSTSELYEIMKLRIEVFVIEQECLYQECDRKDYQSHHLYLLDDKEIVAYARVVRKGISYPDDVSIGRVLIKSTHRNQGLGIRFMKLVIKFIRDNLKEKTIRISAQEYLLHFYKSLDFEPVGLCYLEDGIPHVEMVLNNN